MNTCQSNKENNTEYCKKCDDFHEVLDPFVGCQRVDWSRFNMEDFLEREVYSKSRSLCTEGKRSEVGTGLWEIL